MTNPFENPEGSYIVLVNDEGQYSLWPAETKVPAGWSVVFQKNTRQACLDYVNQNWPDMRPKSLIAMMEGKS
jgi:MbtH protein